MDGDASNGHQVGLGGDGAVVVVTVTAADGATTATYTVTVGRGGAAPAAAARVGLGGIGDLGFEPLVRRYDARVPSGVLSTRVEMVGAGDTALEGFAVTAGDSAVTAVGPDGAVALSQHADTLVVVHAATPRNERQGVYTMLLRASRPSPVPARSSRQAPGSPLSGLQARGSLTDAVRSQGILVVEPRLSGLALSQGTLAPVFAAGTPEYTAQVTSATSQVTVTPTAAPGVTVLVAAPDADPDAVGHQVALNASTADSSAQTAVVIVVWNSAGELDSYTLTITRAATSTGDATLSALTVGELALLPAFDPATTEYTATAAADTATVTVTATKTQSGATATVTPTDADTGTVGDQVDLAEPATPSSPSPSPPKTAPPRPTPSPSPDPPRSPPATPPSPASPSPAPTSPPTSAPPHSPKSPWNCPKAAHSTTSAPATRRHRVRGTRTPAPR